jgi:hypothetical protein
MRLVCGTCSAVQDAPTEASPRCGACDALLFAGQPSPAGAPGELRGLVGRPGHERWFTRRGEEPAGPYSASELSDLLAHGRLTWGSEVWREGLSSWREARRDELLVLGVASARGLGDATTRLDAVHSLLHAQATPALDDGLEFLDLDPDQEGAAVAHPRARGPRLESEEELDLDDLEADELYCKGERPREQGSAPHPSAGRSSAEVVTGRLPRDSLPGRARRPRSGTLVTALAAFVVGALLALGPLLGQAARELLGSLRTTDPSLEARPRARESSIEEPAAQLGASPPPASAPWAAPPVAPHVPAPALRARPTQPELRAALRKLSPVLRHCMRDPREGLTLELVVDGSSGSARQLDVASLAPPSALSDGASLAAGELECISDVFVDFHIPPFTEPTARSKYRYRW